MLQLIKTALTAFFSNSKEAVSPLSVAEDPRFLLLETTEEFRLRKAELEAERLRFCNSCMKEKQRLLSEAETLESAPSVSMVEDELRCRRIEALRAEAKKKNEQVRGRDSLATKLKELELSLRKEEQGKIIEKGKIILSSYKEGAHKDCREERRLVECQGKSIILLLTQKKIFRATGRKITIADERLFPLDVPEMVPTGQFEPEVVLWATDSVAQMTEEELRAIAALDFKTRE